MQSKFNIIGKNVIRQDGLEKVTGQAKFADDINYPNQLFGVMVRLPVSHAKIISLNYSEVKNNKSIVTICDANDIPGANKIGPIKKDQPVFAYDKIRTPGDVVCMLLGESESDL
ncbi:MAG: xanthine dehydrogenase, partial [Calditrichia bacterium]|nr:xanthine dehydrogenase [Calditrichia bacterium]